MSRIIGGNDMMIVKEMADKYNLSVADFGREITKQNSRNPGRQMRLTEDENRMIRKRANTMNLSMSRYCELCCTSFIHKYENGEVDTLTFYENCRRKGDKRTVRVSVTIYNRKNETKLLHIAQEFSVKLSTLIRYCALTEDIGHYRTVERGAGK